VSSHGKTITSKLVLSQDVMFNMHSPFNIKPKVNVDECLEFDNDLRSCQRSNGTLEYTFSLRCLSRQMFRNGTLINESSLSKQLSVERYVENITEDMAPTNEPQTGQTNIGATVITVLIVIAVLTAIVLVCYAQKSKVRLMCVLRFLRVYFMFSLSQHSY
jgi:hypothetical protein